MKIWKVPDGYKKLNKKRFFDDFFLSGKFEENSLNNFYNLGKSNHILTTNT